MINELGKFRYDAHGNRIAKHIFTPTNADDRVYEMSNHLGNVLATFTARKLPLTEAGAVVGFAPHVTSLSDYYPFGSGMEGRTVDGSYRYGFQGQETDAEYFDGAVSFKYRVHDARLGRFLSIDPKYPEYPWNSVYAFSENSVISNAELEGLEAYPAFNEGAEVFSKAGFFEFVDRMVVEMTSAEDVAENQYDCADFCIVLVALYFAENNVAFQYDIGGRTINSEDSKYQGDQAMDDFLEDLKLVTSASNIRDTELTRQIDTESVSKGDLLTSGGHAMIFLGITDQGRISVVQSSGEYHGRGNSKNKINRPELTTNGSFWTEIFTWTFLERTEIERVEPIAPSSLPSEVQERTLQY